MKILIVCQYFWPENFRVNDIALSLKERGHEVIVFTSKPNYPSGRFSPGYSMFGQLKEIWNGITIHRSPVIPRGKGSLMLFLNYLSFIVFGCLKAFFLKIEVDAILVYQLSPVTMALPGIIYKKKNNIKLYLYIQDLWPQSFAAATGFHNNTFNSLLGVITKRIYNNSDCILMQSKAFKKILSKQGVAIDKLHYLPNFAEDFYRPVAQKNEFKHFFLGKINLVFAGNIGESQSFLTLISAARIVKSQNPNISWIIIGDGRKKKYAEELAKQQGIDDVFKFIGSFEAKKMPCFFAYADALLISLKREEIFSLTIPSKLQSYMASGKPVIGSIDGEGKNVIEESGCGFVAPAEDELKLAEIVLKFSLLSEIEKNVLGDNALSYYAKHFDRVKLITYLEELLSTPIY